MRTEQLRVAVTIARARPRSTWALWAPQSALKNERKHVVRMLLHAITRTVGEQPYALRPFMRHRTEIAAKYPDLFLEVRSAFLCCCGIVVL
jgi:hypothetical protein